MPEALQKMDAEAQRLREAISQLHQACQVSARLKARSRELAAEWARVYEAAIWNARELHSLKYSLSQLEERMRGTPLYGAAHPKDRERGGGWVMSPP